MSKRNSTKHNNKDNTLEIKITSLENEIRMIKKEIRKLSNLDK
ncbi:MAG: hypothetical protein ACRC68_14090 [Clostridium sp.]